MPENKKPSKFRMKIKYLYSRIHLSTVIMVSFTVTAIIASCFMGISFYNRFSSHLEQTLEKEINYTLQQAADTFTEHMRNFMAISNTIGYDIVRNMDFQTDNINQQLNLLYNINKDKIESISMHSMDGELIDVAPAAIVKQGANITRKDWFIQATKTPENQHFSMPHIQKLFINTDYKYTRVISLSRVISITKNNISTQAVLLIDIKYSAIEEFLNSIRLGEGYIYLANSNGEIICHPQAQLVWSGELDNEDYSVKGLRDDSYMRTIEGKQYTFKVQTTGYTGWKLVGVIPTQSAQLSNLKSNLFSMFLVVLFIAAIFLINLLISQKITKPIKQLEKAVKLLAQGDLDVAIPRQGFFEIWHLENGIRKMTAQLRQLLDDTVRQQQSIRKSEFDVLQSQINPHFLYNTLDIIVWLIENKRHEDAVRAVTALARFFRISLSKGRAIITVGEEIEHIRNYLLIQEMRYKNKFTYTIDMHPEVAELATIKLLLQPIVENAIYHAMEFMDGDGKIEITAMLDGDDLLFVVEDNGQGMPKDKVEKLENGEIEPSKRGSGTGVSNVSKRVRLEYGDGYGLKVFSEPDEGTKIVINIPAGKGGMANV